MDDMDRNLIVAWDKVVARCEADPAEARRRWRRTSAGAMFDRPPRAWCLAVRASDSRLGGIEGAVDEPEKARRALAHRVVLDGSVLRELGGPVWIRWPGVRLTEASAMLGIHREVLRKWLPVRPGRTRGARSAFAAERSVDGRVAWVEADPGTSKGSAGSEGSSSAVLHVRYEPATVFGGRGMAVPVVWSDGPLDPGFDRGAPPHPVWGSLWQGLADRIDADFEQVVERVPVTRRYGAGERFRGWQWVCPGRRVRGTDGAVRHTGCGRLAKKLVAPLPVWTVPRALGEETALEVSGRRAKPALASAGSEGTDPGAVGHGGFALSGAWWPGVVDRLAGMRSLACEQCWGVRWLSPADSTGWNEVVSYLTGGLLYGHEVDRPGWVEATPKVARGLRRNRSGQCEDAERDAVANAAQVASAAGAAGVE
ncbi:hypothetical protein OT109_07225 [Phycisphaeraceae bacterium D3-23]